MARKAAPEQMERTEQEMFNQFLDEFRRKPLDYVRHDANARCDKALRRATIEHGMAFLGSWWVLVELLSACAEHEYDVRDETGWQLFAADMSTCGKSWSVDECKTFCDQLSTYGLINAELYSRGKVTNNRICREVEGYANAAAGKKLGSWKACRSRAGL